MRGKHAEQLGLAAILCSLLVLNSCFFWSLVFTVGGTHWTGFCGLPTNSNLPSPYLFLVFSKNLRYLCKSTTNLEGRRATEDKFS